jgi:hypothetical protein
MMINPASRVYKRWTLVGEVKMTEHYSIERAQIQAILDKAKALTRWLAENAPNCETSQRHLDPGTIEQKYWHYGYVCAIRDILSLLEPESTE